MDTKTSDYELVLAAQNGDKTALEALLERLRASLFALAYRELGHYDDAQDAVASGMLRACKQIRQLQKPESARAWLFRIVQNEARRLRSDRQNFAPLFDETTENVVIGLEENGVILRADINKALRDLPYDQARAVGLFYLDGLPVRDVAAQFSRPEGTIKYWLHKGRQTLSHEMEGYVYVDTPAPLTAAIISTDLAPDLLAQMTNALSRAGWANVQTRSDFADLGAAPPPEGQPKPDPHPLWNRRLLVLDEWIHGRSVFEFLPILRGRADAKNIALFVLINGGRDEEAEKLTVLSAYLSGVDMLLTKPFQMEEFHNFARRIYEFSQG